MRFNILTIFLSCIYLAVNATPQVPDTLIYRGDTLPLFSNPLEEYIEAKGIGENDRGCNASACRRGYVATWKIRNDSLFLRNIKPCGNYIVAGVVTGLDCEELDTSKVMKFLIAEFNDQEIFADWYSGVLLSPQGRLVKYIHMGYNSTFERELQLEIENGLLKNQYIKENSFSDSKMLDQFNYELIQDSLFHYIATRIDWKKVGGDMICDGWYNVIFTKNGWVKKIKYDPEPDETKWEAFWWNLSISNCRQVLKKAVADINFKEMLTHGGQVPKTVELEIYYNSETDQLTLEN